MIVLRPRTCDATSQPRLHAHETINYETLPGNTALYKQRVIYICSPKIHQKITIPQHEMHLNEWKIDKHSSSSSSCICRSPCICYHFTTMFVTTQYMRIAYLLINYVVGMWKHLQKQFHIQIENFDSKLITWISKLIALIDCTLPIMSCMLMFMQCMMCDRHLAFTAWDDIKTKINS